MQHTFVGLPEGYERVMLVDAAGKDVRQVLWGDWLTLDDTTPDTDPQWRHVIWRPKSDNPEKLRVRREHTRDRRPLEIVFVDVGQGDGSVLITPERDDSERIIVIDAGIGEEMADFLYDRFKAYDEKRRFHAVVLTHPDEDHYLGFRTVFDRGQVSFDHLYHSGLVERAEGKEWERLGGRSVDGDWLEGLVETDAQMRAAFSGPPGETSYARTIASAMKNNCVGQFGMLSTVHGHPEAGRMWVPGFAPSDDRDYEIEILGPVVEAGPDGGPRLRRLGKYGETKNGHSVILRLTYKGFSVLFGGDLNLLAEKFLLTHYSGLQSWPDADAGLAAMVAKARQRFRSDVMKVCHHGSSDVTDEFIEAVDPAAFVISSGDEEGHVHPRPDLLGRLGRKGRGHSPVLLSTELQRSTRAAEDRRLVEKLQKALLAQEKKWTGERATLLNEGIATLWRSNVQVDGAIYVKTDGDRLITAFKIESGSAKKKWFYFEYRLKDGELELVPRKGAH